MQIVNLPTKFNIPFGDSASAPFINPVPQNPTGVPGRASLQTGFPPENFSPVAAGGVPPFGGDFNGLLNQISDWNRWQAAGVAFPPYDPVFQVGIGGYPASALVSSRVEQMLIYYCLVDNNLTDPDAGGAGWFIWSRRLQTNTDLYVNAATGNDNNNGLTPSTAKQTIQAAVNTAWTFPPSTFIVTIHIADGTYNESVVTPSIPGPPVIITGNAALPQNVIVNAGAGSTFTAQGPNTVTIQNLHAICTNANSAAFSAINAAVVTTNNTRSGIVMNTGWVFIASGGGRITPGSHTFTTSFGAAFAAFQNGTCTLQAGAVFTLSASLSVQSFAQAVSGGSIEVPGTSVPTFVNPGNANGSKYSATLNGIINTQGQGVNYFPGTLAGVLNTGGQYG